jgi:cytochrome c551/c552
MKKLSIIAILVLFVSGFTQAQNDQGTLDDIGRVTLTPVLAKDLGDMPASAQNLLLSKLRQIATKNGLGGTAVNPQFIITATVSVITKGVTETAPPMIAYNLEANLYIVDYTNKKTLANATVELKGVGKNETKAFTAAIKNINPKSTIIRSFVKKGKEKIIEYYNTQCEFIMKQAQALVKMDKYEEAIYMLITVPEVCKECHYKALDAIDPIYKKMMGENCKEDLEAAQTAFNDGNMESAKNYLEKIEPGTDCYDKAVDLAKKINNMDPQSRGIEGEVKMKAAAPATREEKTKAYKEVAAQHSSNQTTEYDLNFMSDHD